MKDYQSNTHKEKEAVTKELPEKNVEKVVVGEVLVQKKSLGKKFKDIFIEADLKSVLRYVGSEVLLPAARNMIVDASSKGVERMMYGESAVHRRRYTHGPGPRITYNSPISRAAAQPRDNIPRHQMNRANKTKAQKEFILQSREEAELVLERLGDIIDAYEFASVGDLHELLGEPTTYVDNKWGWIFIGDANVVQIREGFLLDLPPAEPI